MSVEPAIPDAGERVVGPDDAVPHAHEYHDLLQDAPSSVLDSLAGAYSADYATDDVPMDRFFEAMFDQDTDLFNDNTTETNDDTTAPSPPGGGAIRPFSDLDNTFLTPELSLSAPSVTDFSAIYCEGSAT